MRFTRQFSSVVRMVLSLVMAASLLAACGGGDGAQVASQQLQISALKTQLASIQLQLTSAQTQDATNSDAIAVAITSLTQSQTALAQLTGQSPAQLSTAVNQVLVLQSLADSLTATTATVSTAYTNSQTSLASLTTQLTALQTQLTALTAQNTASAATNATQAAQITSLNGQITTLNGQISTLQIASNALSGQLAAANGTIATRDATIVSLNSAIASLNAQISAMVAVPVQMAVSATSSTISTPVTVTVTFPDNSQNANTVTFTSQGGGGSFSPAVAPVSGATATTTFTSGTAGTFNINAVLGTYSGGATVTFTSIPSITYSISGTVRLSGVGQAGVIMLLSGGATNATTTASDGSYSFTGLVNGPYTIKPSILGANFLPFSASVVVNGANVSGQNFAESMRVPQEAVVHRFGVGSDGVQPLAPLIQASDGNFYGTTQQGGATSQGTVYKLTLDGVETVLYSFGGADGAFPQGNLIQGSDGNLYGTTAQGGASNQGTVFSITTSGVLTVLHSFGSYPDGSGPRAGLVQASDGNFYGTTVSGGADMGGTVFKITPAGVETVLHAFSMFGFSDGSGPQAELILGSDGNFYGTTSGGGANGRGTVFKITPAGIETVLWSFGAGTDGRVPYAALIQASDGNFYGTTSQGGTNGFGTVFKITPAGVETVLWNFGAAADGTGPDVALIQASDGNFYGTTSQGGTNGVGTIFKITSAGVETVLWNFGSGSDGSYPFVGGLIQASDGNFYGTTDSGGGGYGTVFKLVP